MFHIVKSDHTRWVNSSSSLSVNFVPVDSSVCSLHLVNEGVSVSNGTVRVEWQATGPTAENKVSSFTCFLDSTRKGVSCER